jgi:hypothetical protein
MMMMHFAVVYFRPLIFLALNTQSGHWVDAGVWIAGVAVDTVWCLVWSSFVVFCLDLDVICCCGRFESKRP